jgi:hypothetical protein
MTGLMDCHAQLINRTLKNPSDDIASRVASLDDHFDEATKFKKRKKSTKSTTEYLRLPTC